MLRQGLKPGESKAAAPARGFAALVWQGFWTNALNPKIALFFLALLPPFIAPDAPSKPLAFLLLGAWFIAQGGLFSLVFVSLVAQARKLPSRPGIARGLNLAGAGLFAFLAARLALAKSP
jgi:threonine/homoserine/homoserine lactone efflux protein